MRSWQRSNVNRKPKTKKFAKCKCTLLRFLLQQLHLFSHNPLIPAKNKLNYWFFFFLLFMSKEDKLQEYKRKVFVTLSGTLSEEALSSTTKPVVEQQGAATVTGMKERKPHILHQSSFQPNLKNSPLPLVLNKKKCLSSPRNSLMI